VAYFLDVYYHKSFQNHTPSTIIVAVTSHVRASAMLVYWLVWNKNCGIGVASNGVHLYHVLCTSVEGEAWTHHTLWRSLFVMGLGFGFLLSK